jgi:hypothetical protein
VLLEERKRLRAVLVVEPASVPELDEQVDIRKLLARPLEVLERAVAIDHVRRQLEQDTAELARLAERRDRREEAAEDLAAHLPRHPLDPSVPVHLEPLVQVRRQLLELHGMACHRRERLDVEDEAVRSPLGPVRRRRLAREPVEGRVDLGRVEVLGVVAKPLLARADAGRVPVLHQGVVGERARADADGSCHHRIVPTVVLVDAENARRSRWPNLSGDELARLARDWAERLGVDVEVVFEPAAGTADDVIARRADELAEADRPYWLVTSDRGLRARAGPRAERTIGGGAFVKLLGAG